MFDLILNILKKKNSNINFLNISKVSKKLLKKRTEKYRKNKST